MLLKRFTLVISSARWSAANLYSLQTSCGLQNEDGLRPQERSPSGKAFCLVGCAFGDQDDVQAAVLLVCARLSTGGTGFNTGYGSPFAL